MALATPSTPRRTELRPGTAGAPAHAKAPKTPRFRRLRKLGLPYLFLFPALVLELLIHLIPMVWGVVMSFLKLTQFYIANWTEAPGAGFANYKVSIDFGGPIGSALLHSLWITIEYTVLSVGVWKSGSL